MTRTGQLDLGSRNHKEPFRIWGLTGGVAAGKSTVAKLLVESGIPVIDADKISHELMQPDGPANHAIRQRFGTDDRRKLREIVFTDPKARRDIEAILHPMIEAETLKRMRLLRSPIVVYEAALLVETGRYKTMEGLIVVEADKETRKRRLMDRDQTLPDIADGIISSQASDEERRAAATLVIENNGNEEELRNKVTAVIRKIRKQ